MFKPTFIFNLRGKTKQTAMGNAAPENTTSPPGTLPIQFLAIHWIQPPFSSKAAASRCSKSIAPTRENAPQKQQQQLASRSLYVFFKQPYKIIAPTNTTTKHTASYKKRPSFFQVLYNNDYYQTLQMQHRNLFSMSKPGHPKPQKVEQLTH